MKIYQVSLVISNIEAEDEADAIKQFDLLTAEMDNASYEVEEEKNNN